MRVGREIVELLGRAVEEEPHAFGDPRIRAGRLPHGGEAQPALGFVAEFPPAAGPGVKDITEAPFLDRAHLEPLLRRGFVEHGEDTLAPGLRPAGQQRQEGPAVHPVHSREAGRFQDGGHEIDPGDELATVHRARFHLRPARRSRTSSS